MEITLTSLQEKKIKHLINRQGVLLHQATVTVMMPNGHIALIDPAGRTAWMPLREATDHAAELGRLLSKYRDMVHNDVKYKSSAYGVWAKRSDLADQRLLESLADKALAAYEESLK
jgi:hypothetical protein